MPAADWKNARNLLRIWLIVMAVVSTVSVWPADAGSLTQQELRGRQLYATGISPSGRPVVAYFGKDLLEVPGESATCDSCHGYDGTGRRESGVIPSNITWRHLMKSYGHIHPDGLEHGPFTEKNLKSYMEDGRYPGGRQGDPSMPVYEMAAQDLDDLVAYLKKLDSTRDPGVTETHIRIGTLLPDSGPLAEVGEIMRRTIAAYFDDINLRGGIYGRRLQLVSAPFRGDGSLPLFPPEAGSDSGAFALLNTVTPGLEKELWTLAEQQRVPLVAPYAPLALDDQLLHRYRFSAPGGLREQILALARHAARKTPPGPPRIFVLYPQREGMADMVSALEAVFQDRGWLDAKKIGYDSGVGPTAAVLKRLRGDNPDLLFYLGGEAELEAVLRAFADPECRTELYLPGVVAAKAIPTLPPSFKGRFWMSFSALPGDRKEWAVREFQAMAARQKLPVSHPTLQLTAHAAARILVEGLRSSGRDLSRERLVEALEGLFEFDCGLLPLITFSKNRRVGSLGAHIVEFDPDLPAQEGFIVPRGWISTLKP